ncbi:zinc-ribbon domain-containing protein [Curtobacterium sp. ISL-83]|uniref:zinc-ribbon domain-containing protein n=1 Tax=Curtobacterium sp. ISL-83 TaxID=2819145 RepID=UPI001BE93923|nr:zinc-ribbon domain-containing protein [Curtobacterium sp. ISL-83]MBT2501526.1 zinc-ribbon domain-containing protein [Curtobacterium sp. ISL-83]
MTLTNIAPLPLRVRPRGRETPESYSRRLLERHGERDAHRRARIRDVRESISGDLPDEELWFDHILPRLARRDLSCLQRAASVRGRHPDGSSCESCPDVLTEQWMCTACAKGASIAQYPHFRSPVCRRHRRWVGLFGDVSQQHAVDESTMKAARRLQRLKRDGRVDARFYRIVVSALTTGTGTTTDGHLEAARFVDAVNLMAMLTRMTTLPALFDPSATHTRRFEQLGALVRATVPDASNEAVRILWLYLLPTAARLRARLRGETPDDRFAHDFPLTDNVLSRFQDWFGVPGGFAEYLLASGDTIQSAFDVGIEQDRRKSEPPETLVLQAFCARGHAVNYGMSTRPRRKAPRCTSCQPKLPKPGVNDVASKYPDLAHAIDLSRNAGLTAFDINIGSSNTYVWICRNGHPFEATAASVTGTDVGCRFCKGKAVLAGYNDLHTTHPELAAEWDAANSLKISQVGSGDRAMGYWMCPEGHHEVDEARDRVARGGCGTCERASLLAASKSLVQTHPLLAEHWDRGSNGRRAPEDFTAEDRVAVWWLCENGHGVKERIDFRARRNACSKCVARTVFPGVNDVATTHPALATEWHPWKNTNAGPEHSVADATPFHWRCRVARHEIQQTVSERERAGGCPICPVADRLPGIATTSTEGLVAEGPLAV